MKGDMKKICCLLKWLVGMACKLKIYMALFSNKPQKYFNHTFMYWYGIYGINPLPVLDCIRATAGCVWQDIRY